MIECRNFSGEAGFPPLISSSACRSRSIPFCSAARLNREHFSGKIQGSRTDTNPFCQFCGQGLLRDQGLKWYIWRKVRIRNVMAIRGCALIEQMFQFNQSLIGLYQRPRWRYSKPVPPSDFAPAICRFPERWYLPDFPTKSISVSHCHLRIMSTSLQQIIHGIGCNIQLLFCKVFLFEYEVGMRSNAQLYDCFLRQYFCNAEYLLSSI